MKNKGIFITTVWLLLLLMISACGNTGNETNKQLDPEQSKQVPTQSEKEQPLITHNENSLKETYIKEFNRTQKELEEVKPADASTYAMKKVEGDRYDAWDALLNEVYQVLEEELSTKEMAHLREEQRNWLNERDDTAKNASLKFEGGTQEQLEYVSVLANLTEERCYELINTYL
ncbi:MULTISPECIES: lysozyme inhibitor LprI family protein [Cytobacillus]|uniref:DUF1311 domain-containing protein n=1 Tax=Cytobacillus stercorigallinarum TaxID=2762240 RepID=A0ABR8QVY0_9BACI|nr:lysozyme inhibitor LprI family protein [Cytobacillus stercorigallinarum]MBD7939668.1 DUF1311 domain-containing protein [Cytobacillus stercorigallinarum]